MDASMNIGTRSNPGAIMAAGEKADLRPVQAKSGKLIIGESLKILNDRNFLEGFDREDISLQELVSSWIDQKFAAMKEIAKNMGVSEEERAEAERRLEELEELRKELEDKKIEYRDAVKKFEILGISAGDKAALEMALALENPAYV